MVLLQFKPASGSWQCSGFYYRNASGVITCPACKTKVDREKQEQKPLGSCVRKNGDRVVARSSMSVFSAGVSPGIVK